MMRILAFLLLICSYTVGLAMSDAVQTDECRKLKDLGNQVSNEGKYSEALDLYTQSLELADLQGDLTTYTSALGSIGNMYCLFKNYDRGAYYYNKGYKAAIEQKNQRLQCIFLVNMVLSNCFAGKAQAAEECWEKAKLLSAWNDTLMQYYDRVCTGSIAWAYGRFDEALQLHRQGLVIAQQLGLGSNYELAQHESIGLAFQGMGQLDSALYHYHVIEQQTDNRGLIDLENTAYTRLAEAYELCHDTARARYYREKNALLADSLFYGPNMDRAMNRLFSYEKRANDNQVMSLHKTIDVQTVMIFIFCCMILVLIILTFVIKRKNRSLTDAYELLVEKNQEQIQLLEKSRQLREPGSAPVSDIVEPEPEEEGETTHVVMSPQQAAQLLNDVDAIMQDLRLISSADFNLSMLAKLVESNTRYVSWVINDTYGKNFKTYLNEFRIREASRRMADPQYDNITIAAIAEMVGFNSTNTFILAFKKVVGMTPSVYQKLAKNKNLKKQSQQDLEIENSDSSEQSELS